MVRQSGGVTGVHVIRPRAPGGLRLCAHGQQVLPPFEETGGSHLQNSSGNVHQILLSTYSREELKQRVLRRATGSGRRRGGGLSREGPIGSFLLFSR